jgi:Flp pilus assembly protein TadG
MRRVLTGTRFRDERGVALTEFALVLPVLMLLLLGMLDLGKAFNYWIDQTHLANLGARWAAVDKTIPSGTLQDYIKAQANTEELKSSGTSDSVPDGVKVCIWFPEGASNVGNAVEVQVWSEYHFIPFVGDNISFLTAEITGQATMRIEQLPSAYSVADNDAGTGKCA